MFRSSAVVRHLFTGTCLAVCDWSVGQYGDVYTGELVISGRCSVSFFHQNELSGTTVPDKRWDSLGTFRVRVKVHVQSTRRGRRGLYGYSHAPFIFFRFLVFLLCVLPGCNFNVPLSSSTLRLWLSDLVHYLPAFSVLFIYNLPMVLTFSKWTGTGNQVACMYSWFQSLCLESVSYRRP